MKKRVLRFEALEHRRVLAGNVLANVVNGELVISGDNLANSIELVSVLGADGTGRTFRISGKPFEGFFRANGTPISHGRPTLINGRTQPVELFVPSLKVTIDTKDHNDAVTMRGPGVGPHPRFQTSGLTIDTGTGRDYVALSNGKDLSLNPVIIRTASANPTLADLEVHHDIVNIKGFTARRSMQLTTGGGNDRVLIDNFAVTNGTTLINTGAGLDTVRITSSDFDRLNLETGASNVARSNLEDDRDVVYFAAVRGNSATLSLGGGDDLVTLARIGTVGIEVAGRVTVNGGTGSDEIRGTENAIFVGSFVGISVEVTS